MLPDFMRQQLIQQAAKTLTDRCTIYALAQVQDEYGAADEEPSIVASNVPCRVVRASRPTGKSGSAIRDVAAQETMVEMYELFVPNDTALDVDQEIEVGGVRYEVVRIEVALTDRFFKLAQIVRRR